MCTYYWTRAAFERPEHDQIKKRPCEGCFVKLVLEVRTGRVSSAEAQQPLLVFHNLAWGSTQKKPDLKSPSRLPDYCVP